MSSSSSSSSIKFLAIAVAVSDSPSCPLAGSSVLVVEGVVVVSVVDAFTLQTS